MCVACLPARSVTFASVQTHGTIGGKKRSRSPGNEQGILHFCVNLSVSNRARTPVERSRVEKSRGTSRSGN